MPRPLSVSHFAPRPRIPASAMPGAARLAQRLASSCATALNASGSGPWRITLEGIEDDAVPGADAEWQEMRLASGPDALPLTIGLDRGALSAVIEAMMGGTGTEAPFSMADRPLSRIEQGLLRQCQETLAAELAQALSHELGRGFTVTGDPGPTPAAMTAACAFRYSANLYGYSGEIRLLMPREALAGLLDSATGDAAQVVAEDGRERLQGEIGKSMVTLTVMLGSETLTVEEIAALTPGRLIPLSATVTGPVRVVGGNIAAFEGRLARAGDRLAVSLTRSIG